MCILITYTARQEIALSTIYQRSETLCLGGVRSGKSMVITEAAIQSAFQWETEVNGILAAPTFGQLERNLLEPWRELAPKGKWEEIKSSKDPHIECRIGKHKYVKIYLASGKHPETIEGATVGWIAGTELQQMQAFWTRARRRVSDKHANKLRWFGDGLTEEGWLSKEIEKDGINWLQFSTLENVLNLAPGYLEKMRQDLTPRQWQIYILGIFASAEDAVFATYKRAIHVLDLVNQHPTYQRFYPEPIDRRWPVIIGQDFNLDPMASVMCQFIDGCLFVIGELIEPGHMQEHTARLVAWCKNRGLNYKDPRQVYVVPDASGGNRGQGDGKSNIYILQQAGFTVRARPKNPLKVDSDQSLLVLLENANDPPEHHCFFDRHRCPKTIDAVAGLRYKDRDDNSNPLTHPTDALKYVAFHCAPVRAPTHNRGPTKPKSPTNVLESQQRVKEAEQARARVKADRWQSSGRSSKIFL